VKTLESASDTVGDSVSALNLVNNLSTTSERGGASERNFPADLLMLSETDEARFSGIILNPVKSLETASDTVELSVSALDPVKSLAIESDTVGLSVSPRNPVKILSTTSEKGGASERNFPADLLMLSETDEVRSSYVALKPVKSLPKTSEGERVSAANFPTPLPIMSVIAESRLSEVPLKPVKIRLALSKIVDVRSSGTPRAPVKILLRRSEGEMVSEANFPAALPTMSVSAATRLSVENFPASLLMLADIALRSSEIPLNPVKILITASDSADAISSDRAREPAKALFETTEREGFSLSLLNPWKEPAVVPERGGVSDGNLPTPLPIESERGGVSERDVVKALRAATNLTLQVQEFDVHKN